MQVMTLDRPNPSEAPADEAISGKLLLDRAERYSDFILIPNHQNPTCYGISILDEYASVMEPAEIRAQIPERAIALAKRWINWKWLATPDQDAQAEADFWAMALDDYIKGEKYTNV